MDNKQKFITLWEEAGGEQAEKGILKKIAKKLKVPEGTIRRWKSEHIKKNKVNVQRTNDKSERSGKEREHNNASLVEEVIDPILETENAKSSYRLFSEKEKEFIRYYFLYRFNIKAATLKAGYTFENEGSRLLRKPKIKRAIELIRLSILEHDNLNITPEYLIEELHTNLLKASGNLPQIRADLVPYIEKKSHVEIVTLEEGNIKDGEKIPTKYKEVFKKEGEEIRTEKFIEEYVYDTNPKEVVNSIKALVSLYGYSPYYKLEEEKFKLEKEKYDDEKAIEVENENNSKNIITEIIGKADLNAKNNNS